ncbi:MAG: hypothetical protein WCW40_11310 [Bacteroidota bacterium]
MKIKTFLTVIAVISMIFFGCKKDDPAPLETGAAGEPVPPNIFPLTKGKRFDFSGYLTSGSTETAVAGSTTLQASWVVVGDTTLASVFGSSVVSHISKTTATMIIDSLTVPGIISPAHVTPVFIYREANNGDYYYLTNFGNVFRTYMISSDTSSAHAIRSDSLQFIKLSPKSISTGEQFSVFTQTVQSYYFGSTAIPLTINISGKYERKENIQLKLNNKDTTVAAYYLTITNIATLGALPPKTSLSAKFWLAEGIGPVQMFLAGDSEAPGSFRKLVSLH